MRFADRHDAGRRLAAELERYRGEDPVVLGLARGGVVVGLEVARALGAPLEVLVVRKLGAPGAPEFAIGAMAPDATLLDDRTVARLQVPRSYLAAVVARESGEMARRERMYRRGRHPIPVERRTAIVVDDGLATGATARAAVRSVRLRAPRRVVFAAPVCSPEGRDALRAEADDVVCLLCPADMEAVGFWYQDFSPTSDEEVLECLRSAETGRVNA
jgi:predicted phosphoribosyltransferase